MGKVSMVMFDLSGTTVQDDSGVRDCLYQAAREFASPDPVKQHQFAPRVVSLTPDEAVLAMSKCPLVDEWRAMGLPDCDVATLCRVAHSVDFGTWEGALRCTLCFEGTRGEGKDECVLRVKKAPG